MLSVAHPGQQTVHVLPPQTGIGFAVDFDQLTPWNVTGTSWHADTTVDVDIECVTCTARPFTLALGPADLGDLPAFVHATIAAHHGPDAVGIWRATAVGRQSGASFDLLFQVDPAETPLVEAPTTPDLIDAADSGRSHTDDLTNVARPTFTLVAAAGQLVQLLEGGLVIGQGFADSFGAVTIQVDTVLAAGAHVVSAQAVDGASTSAPSGSLTVTIDVAGPVLVLPPGQTAEATGATGSTVSFADPTATDAHGVDTISWSPASGSLFAPGTTHVTVSATDVAGNTTTSSFDIVVGDTIAPVLTVPATQTAEATSPAGAPVSYPAASATDAVGPVTITYSQASGTVFGLGTTHVTVTAKDAAGNTSTGSFDVVVVDTTAPVLTVPATQTAEATSPAGATVSYPAASATDAVGPVTITYSQASGTVFGLGTTHVTVTATDAAGNASIGSFDVVVVDTTAPLLTVPATQTRRRRARRARP